MASGSIPSIGREHVSICRFFTTLYQTQACHSLWGLLEARGSLSFSCYRETALWDTGRQVHRESYIDRENRGLTQNVVGPKGCCASNSGTTLTRNDLDRYIPRKQFSKLTEPRGPCFLVP